MKDLVQNDDSIIENGFFVRDILGKNTAIVSLLVKYIENVNFEDNSIFLQHHNYSRVYALDILGRIYARTPSIKKEIDLLGPAHEKKLMQAKDASPNKSEIIDDELKSLRMLLNAPNDPPGVGINAINFEETKPTDISGGKCPKVDDDIFHKNKEEVKFGEEVKFEQDSQVYRGQYQVADNKRYGEGK